MAPKDVAYCILVLCVSDSLLETSFKSPTDHLTSEDILNHILWYITDYKPHEIDFPSWSSDIQWQ